MTDKTIKSTRPVRTDAFGRTLKAQTYEMIPEINQKLTDVAKEFKLTMGEVLEVVLTHVDLNAMAPHLSAVRERKLEIRENAKRDRAESTNPKVATLAKQLKDLSPERLAEIQALIDKN